MVAAAVAPPRGMAGAALGARKAIRSAYVTVARRTVAASASGKNPFVAPERDGFEQALSKVPMPAGYALAAALVAVAAGGGVTVGGAAGRAGQVAGGLVGAAGAAFVVKTAAEKRPVAAAKDLQDILAAMEDPRQLRRAEVESVGAKYGLKVAEACGLELRQLLQAFIGHVMPSSPQESLSGDEAAQISAFMTELGITEQDAAGAFVDYARMAMRSRMETGSRTQQVGEQRMFQRAIYVSGQVFGAVRAAYLLPWKRYFPGVTDAQIAVSRRECARQIFVDRMAASGELRMERDELRALREASDALSLEPDAAADVINLQARKAVEAALERAASLNKQRGRTKDVAGIVRQLDYVIEYNRRIRDFAADPELFPSLREVTMATDSVFRLEGRMRDLRDLFQTFVDASCTTRFTDAEEAKAMELRTVMGLSPREAEDMITTTKSNAYKDMLREAYVSGALEKAASKAEALQDICDAVNFDSEAALQIKIGIYRQRVEQVVESGSVSDATAAELDKLRVLFCIEDQYVESIERETKGREFLRVVQDAFNAGVDGFSDAEVAMVRAVKDRLRVPDKLAVELLKEAARSTLMKFVTASRVHANKLDQAKELKKMVFFSNVVLAPLLDAAKGPEWEKRDREAAEKEARANAELEKIVREMQQENARRQRRAREEGKTLEEIDKEEEEEERRKADEMAAREEAGTKGEAAEGSETEGRAEAAEATDAEVVAEAATEAEDQPKSLQKAEKAKEARAGGESVDGVTRGAQKEITLQEDLDERDRKDIYRNFLIYCMTGDVVRGPMGVVMTVERDEADFARLSQLGDLLGLDRMQAAEIHKDLAEQAFKAQVEGIVGGGDLNQDRLAKIEQLREELGLDEAAADKVIKGVQSKRVASTLETFRKTGELTLDKVLEAANDGVDVSDFMGEDSRLNLYRAEVERLLTNGEGAYEAERVRKALPESLKVPAAKTDKIVAEVARERRRLTLVQAVSDLRQRNSDGVVRSLNNLISCERAEPEGPVQWKEQEELKDLFCAFVSREKDEQRQEELQAVLGLSGAEAQDLRDMVSSGKFQMAATADNSTFF